MRHVVCLAVTFGDILVADPVVPDNDTVAIASLALHAVEALAAEFSDQVYSRLEIQRSADRIPGTAALLWGDKLGNGDARQHSALCRLAGGARDTHGHFRATWEHCRDRCCLVRLAKILQRHDKFAEFARGLVGHGHLVLVESVHLARRLAGVLVLDQINPHDVLAGVGADGAIAPEDQK